MDIDTLCMQLNVGFLWRGLHSTDRFGVFDLTGLIGASVAWVVARLGV
ncbi:MAG: hypothetical protein ACJAZO_002196 [Myxococcota bacterium]|jgi:hypothetical protein